MNIARYYFVDNHPERYDDEGEWVRHTDYIDIKQKLDEERSAAHLREQSLQQQLAAAREALALFFEFDDAGEPPGDVCFEKARATLQRDRQP